MTDQPLSDTPTTVDLANDLPGLIEAAAKNLEDNWKAPEGHAPRQLPIVIGQAQATLAQAIATDKLAREQETANLINYLNVASQYRLPYVPSEAALKSAQARVEERIGLA